MKESETIPGLLKQLNEKTDTRGHRIVMYYDRSGRIELAPTPTVSINLGSFYDKAGAIRLLHKLIDETPCKTCGRK